MRLISGANELAMGQSVEMKMSTAAFREPSSSGSCNAPEQSRTSTRSAARTERPLAKTSQAKAKPMDRSEHADIVLKIDSKHLTSKPASDLGSHKSVSHRSSRILITHAARAPVCTSLRILVHCG